MIDEDNQIQKEFFSENGSMYSICGSYDFIFYVIAGLETSILNRNLEELAHINGMSNQYAYKEDTLIVNNNVRLSPDGMGFIYSRNSIIFKTGKVLFTVDYNNGDVRKVKLSNGAILVETLDKEQSENSLLDDYVYNTNTKTIVFDHDMNEIKEFTSDEFDYVIFAQTFDEETSYIVAVESRKGGIGTSTFLT